MPTEALPKCLNCNRSFTPDCRHRLEQRYCGKRQCQRVRRQANLESWRKKPENEGYWRGEWNVERVREWRALHPGYWKKQRRKKAVALQNSIKITQETPKELEKSDLVVNCATKPDGTLLEQQSPVVVGLIAHLTGSTLQNAIGEMTLRLFETGRAVMGPDSNYENCKANPEHPAPAARA